MIHEGLEDLDPDRYGVCVVGSGPVGISLALELERLGLSVLVLESGGRAMAPWSQDLSAALRLDPARHDDMRIAVARRLGGTSNLWGGRCLPFDPIDFIERPGLPDWPIEPADIAPFLGDACRLVSCGKPVFEDPIPGLDLDDGAFSHATLERWSMRPRLQIAHEAALETSTRIDIRLNTTVVDVAFDEGRVCHIVAARPDGERRRIPVARLVLAGGGLETTRLLLSLQRTSPGRFGGPEGPLGRYYMGHLIGEIADVTFASDAIDKAYDFYSDPQDCYIRRRFVPSLRTQLDHDLLNISFWPVVPAMADHRHRSGILSAAFLALSFGPLGRTLVPEAIRTRHIAGEAARAPHIANVLRDLPGASGAACSFLWKRFVAAKRMPGFFVRNAARRYGLSYHSEQSPRAESRVRLGDRVDSLGLPRLEIDYRVHPDDARSVARAHDLLAAWLERNRLGRIDFRQSHDLGEQAVLDRSGHGTHQIGTARMGRSSTAGVVDRNLKVFGHHNLYVASTAVLPRSGQANPTFTTIALALRLAKHLAAAPAALEPSASRQRAVEWT